MRKSRYTEEQIVGILKESEAGVATPELCRKHGVSQQTFYRWEPNVRKGSKLYIEGKLQTSTWEDKQSGKRKYRTEIVARDCLRQSTRSSRPTFADSERRPKHPSEAAHSWVRTDQDLGIYHNRRSRALTLETLLPQGFELGSTSSPYQNDPRGPERCLVPLLHKHQRRLHRRLRSEMKRILARWPCPQVSTPK